VKSILRRVKTLHWTTNPFAASDSILQTNRETWVK